MQTKELIKALRAESETWCSNGYHVDVKNDMLSQAADALEATLWRDDVENAPKDGTDFLCCDGNQMYVCFWDKDDREFVSDPSGKGGGEWVYPESWKPLTPPEAE